MTQALVYEARRGMTAWAGEVVSRRVYAMLGTVNPDGSPHLVPLMFAFDGERFLFESRSTTRKVRNIEARPRARVLVEGPAELEGWVAADGPAHVVRGEEAQDLNAVVAGRYLTEEGREGWAQTIAPLDDVAIVLTPETWASWDVSGMFDVIAGHGYTEDEAMGWFLPLDP